MVMITQKNVSYFTDVRWSLDSIKIADSIRVPSIDIIRYDTANSTKVSSVWRHNGLNLFVTSSRSVEQFWVILFSLCTLHVYTGKYLPQLLTTRKFVFTSVVGWQGDKAECFTCTLHELGNVCVFGPLDILQIDSQLGKIKVPLPLT